MNEVCSDNTDDSMSINISNRYLESLRTHLQEEVSFEKGVDSKNTGNREADCCLIQLPHEVFKAFQPVKHV